MAAPTATEIREVLEGYGITAAVLSDDWINDCRDEEIIPHIEDVTGLVFTTAEATKTEYYSGTGLSTLLLNRKPVNEIVNITEVGALVEGNLNDSVELDQAEGILKIITNFNEGVYGPIFKRGDRNIKITYKYGYSDYPVPVSRAIKNLVAAKCLVSIGNRTGGGDLSVQAHGRSYGSHGKYTHIRKELVAAGYALLKKYMTGVIGS